MKFFLTLSLFLTLISITTAQPTIFRENFFAPGDEIFILDSDVIPDPGMSGENRTWDFSTIPVGKDVIRIGIANADTTQYFADFPNSNIAEVSTFDGGQNIEYDRVTNSIFELLGSVTPGVATLTYSNPLTYLEFPFTYSSQWQDTYANTFDFIINPITITTEGMVNTLIDGYGTLILPHATFNDVLRLKVIDESTDTTDLGQGLSEKNVNHDTSYYWVSPSYHGPLCAYSRTVSERTVYLTTKDTVIADHETNESTSFSFDPMSGGSAVRDVQSGKFALYVSPNPFERTLSMEFTVDQSSEMQLILQDLGGNIVFQQTVSAQAGANEVVLNLPEIPSGAYIALLQSAKGADVQKLIRIGGTR
ncbi:MAG TPA: T9SS type A sorting domain-containing protein [Saprospiraceae bacterium]|nr:T9SS type A sorting domain-containing protein [Saprospiraceae bacterium]